MLLTPRRDFAPEECIPGLAQTNCRITPGVLWANSAEVTMVPAPGTVAFPFVLHQINIYSAEALFAMGNTLVSWEVRVGTGAAPMTEIARVGGALAGAALGAPPAFLCFHDSYPVGPVLIPANTRIAATAACDNALALMRVGISLTGFDPADMSPRSLLPYEDRWRRAIAPLRGGDLIPGAAPVNVAIAAGGWVWGVWTQIVAALPRDFLIYGLHFGDPSNTTSRDCIAEIGLGAPAGPPVTFGRLRSSIFLGFPSANGQMYLGRPWLAHAGETISVRMAAGVIMTYDIQLLGVPLN